MAAPTLPSPSEGTISWITETEGHKIDYPAAGFNGFKDADGNFVVFFPDTTADSVAIFYSDDGGATWSESSSSPYNPQGNMSMHDGRGGGIFIDPATGYIVWALVDGGGDDIDYEVLLWDSSNQTLTQKAWGVMTSASSGSQGIVGCIGGWNSANSDILHVAFAYQEDDFNFGVSTVIFDKSDDSVSDVADTTLSADPDAVYRGGAAYAHSSGTNPHLVDTPESTNIVMYYINEANGDAYVAEFSPSGGSTSKWNSSGARLVDTSPGLSNDIFYHPGEDRYYVYGGDASQLFVWKSDSNDPRGSYTEVADYNTDGDTSSWAIDGDYTHAVMIGDVIYFMVQSEESNDWDWVILQYDVNADAWTETELGFAHSDFGGASQGRVTRFHPYDPVAETNSIVAWVTTQRYAGIEYYPLFYGLAGLSVGGAFVGFGPIPIAAT